MKKFVVVAVCMLIAACQPHKYVYRVTFANGDVEYFELDYKPKAGAKTINYKNEIIIGVDKIEKFD